MVDKPPGTIQIASNLFIDKAEITNLAYLEFMNWHLNHFGKNSLEYRSVLPDTNVWSELNLNYSIYDSFYLRHIAYSDFPAVGISYNQAQKYTNWRTDRVVENWLIIKHKISDRGVVPKDSIFTVEKYLTSNYYDYKYDSSVVYLPRYYLPDSSEYILAGAFASQLNLKNYKSCRKKFCEDNLLIECNCLEAGLARPYNSELTLETNCVFCRKDLITHLQGNVREYTNEQGKSVWK